MHGTRVIPIHKYTLTAHLAKENRKERKQFKCNSFKDVS
jgi:hypothetical protein